ncbi:MAG: hypothetical protein NT031_13085 [Planctomycetota bacterium]|nr:hypothetical protein [Planctomycetota bacterium]
MKHVTHSGKNGRIGTWVIVVAAAMIVLAAAAPMAKACVNCKPGGKCENCSHRSSFLYAGKNPQPTFVDSVALLGNPVTAAQTMTPLRFECRTGVKKATKTYDQIIVHWGMTYDRLGRKLTTADQRGVEHTYSYDSAGRLEKDSVTTLSGVDGSVQRIQFAYDALGRADTITSYDAPTNGNRVNGVKFAYDGWGNVAHVYQKHDGTAEVGTGDLYVGYTYADDPTDSAATYIRLTKVTLPNGREVFYNYPASGTIGYAMGRVDNIASTGPSPTAADKFSAYTYLGAGTVVQVQYPAVKISGGGNAMALTYGTGGTYGGFDAFGRVIDQKWTINGATPDEYAAHDREVFLRRPEPPHRQAGRDELERLDADVEAC